MLASLWLQTISNSDWELKKISKTKIKQKEQKE
jgi:hypothetical protein